MDTTDTQHPLPETIYLTESSAGKPLPDQAPPYIDNDDDENLDSQDDDLENKTKDWN